MSGTSFDSINYARCHHFIFKCLRRRCENNHLFFELDNKNNDNFKIYDSEKKNVLKFVRNLNTKEFSVNSIIHLSNESLLSLNNPTLLFHLITYLNEFRQHFKIIIRKNEIQTSEKCTNACLSLETINILDGLYKKRDFTIQLMSENMLAINQCIKISPFLFNKLITENNLREKLFRLAELYLETFHIAPICCKMQALVHFTTLGYVEEFTTFYLMHHQKTFLQIAKLLYPYINKMEEDYMKRSYLEIIPLRFIELKDPKKLLNLLKKFDEYNISVNILRSGRIIRLNNIYDVHHKYLLKLECAKTFANALEALKKLGERFDFYKLGDLSVDEATLFMEPMDFNSLEVFNIKNENLIQYPPKKITYLPACDHCKWRLNKSNMLTIDHFPVAINLSGFDICWYNNKNDFRLILKQLQQRHSCDTDILFADFFKPLFTTSNYILRYSYENYITVNERCCITFLDWWYNEDYYQTVADLITTLNEEEGLCFWFDKHTIKMANVYSYDGNDAYKRSVICKSEIVEAFKILRLILTDLHSFEVTKDGLISFNEHFKFSPIILITIKNRKLFIDAILKAFTPTSDLIKKTRLWFDEEKLKLYNMDEESKKYFQKLNCKENKTYAPLVKHPFVQKQDNFLISIGTEESDIFAKERPKQFWETRKILQPLFVQIARLLNYALEHLPDEYFYDKAFHSIPEDIYYETDERKIQKIYENLKELRACKIPIRMEDDNIIFEWGLCTEIINLCQISNIHFLKHLYELLAEMESESNVRLTINVNRRITTEKQMDEWDNVTVKKEMMRQKSKTLENDLKKCVEIMETLPPDITVLTIIQNGILLIMPYFYMLPSTFIEIKNGYHQKFFEAMKLYHEVFKDILKPLNIWENWKAEVESIFVKSGGYSIIANKASVYLKIIKLLQPNLDFLRKQDLHTLNNCNFITQNLIMRKPKRLLKRLIQLNAKKCFFSVTEYGTLTTPYIELDVNQLLSISDCTQLSNVNNYLAQISEDRVKEKKGHGSANFSILSNGFFQSMANVMLIEGANWFPSREREAYKACLAEFFIQFELKLINLKLSLIINSDGAIMFGNYVWGYLDSFYMTDKNVILGTIYDENKIALLNSHFNYEDALNALIKTCKEDPEQENKLQILNYILETENNLKPVRKEMKSIQNLANIEMAIEIAKLINPTLKYFSKQMLQSEILRIFPTSLWNSWKNDATKTYSRIKNIFSNLEKENISWLLKLNGNICVEQTLVLTMEHLLKIENFEDLQLLLTMVKNDDSKQLICQEDGKYENIEVYKSINKTDDFIVKARQEAEKLKKNKNTVAANGALFFNQNLWIRPKTFLEKPDCPNTFKNLSETLIRIFGENMSFKYGKWNESIIPSFSKHFKEEFDDYCRNFCEAVVQMLPSANYKYLKDQKQFIFNECVLISPLAFFDLLNIEKFVKSLSTYSNHEKSMDEKEADFINAYFDNNSALLEISSVERLEFVFIRHYCLREIGKIFVKHRTFLQQFLPDINNQISDNSANLYNLENLIIKNQYIFRTGILKHFINYKGELKINQATFLIALQIANEIDDQFSCKNLFDFTSVIEIVNEYCNGRNVVKGRVIIENSKNPNDLKDNTQKYDTLLKLIKEQLLLIKDQQSKWDYKFSNELKGLHHWIKHGETANSIYEYYEQMNTFFKNTFVQSYGTYITQITTQNGLKLMRRYEKDDFVGVIVVPRQNEKEFCVATYFCEKKNIFQEI